MASVKLKLLSVTELLRSRTSRICKFTEYKKRSQFYETLVHSNAFLGNLFLAIFLCLENSECHGLSRNVREDDLVSFRYILNMRFLRSVWFGDTFS